MQRRPQHGSASSAFPSSNGGAVAVARGDANPLDRSNSKDSYKRQKRKRVSIVGLVICLPILLGSALLLSTRILSSHNSKLEALSKNKDTKDDGVAAIPKNDKENTAPKTDTKSVAAANNNKNPNDDVEYHIVFSTGCSLYQDWQSYVFFFQAMKSQQPGTVTRIVSGCQPEEEEKMTEQFANEIHPMAPDGRFQIHFTPDYSKTPSGKTFVYWSTYAVLLCRLLCWLCFDCCLVCDCDYSTFE